MSAGADEGMEPSASRLAAGRSGALTAFLGAYGISLLGDRFAEVALPVLILTVTGDPAAAGAVGVSIQAPTFLLALWLGGWVDRRSRRALMVSADAVRAACFGGLAWLAAGEVADLWPYLAIGLVVGTGNVLFAVAGQALLPQLAGGRHLVRANAMLEAGDALATVSGPAAAGAVVARLGASFALAADAASFAVSALLLRFGVRSYRPPPAASGTGASEPADEALGSRLVRRVRARLGLVFADPMQSSVQAALTALSAHGAAVVLAIIVLGRSDLHLSVTRIGIVLGAAGVGGLLASAVTAKWPDPFGTLRGIAATLGLSAGLLVALASAGGFWWALLANGLLDMAVTASFIASGSVRQQRTPAGLMGRVGSVSVVCNAVARVAGVGGVGLLLTALGGRAALLVDAGVLAAAAAIVWLRGGIAEGR